MISIVIGANYGDEGKGKTVDWLCSKEPSYDTAVVRHNGGAQAGHTVVTHPVVQGESGKSHVFHHLGSGSLRGSATVLTENFIVSPWAFVEEWNEFKKIEPNEPHVVIYDRCRVSTPWDALINVALEKKRGGEKHGSCGLGIYETFLRSQYPEYRLTVNDIVLGEHLKKLKLLFSEYYPKRLQELGLEGIANEYDEKGMLLHYLEDCRRLLWFTERDCFFEESSNDYGHIIFEGAQGLRLDMDHKNFPHVTPSKTGLTYPMNILSSSNFDKDEVIDVYYVTRPYLTRHGAGPLEDEMRSLPGINVVDETNIPNEHQGALRLAPLDHDMLGEINSDFSQHSQNWNLKKHLVVNCLDHVENYNPNSWVEWARNAGFESVTLGIGPTRHDMKQVFLDE